MGGAVAEQTIIDVEDGLVSQLTAAHEVHQHRIQRLVRLRGDQIIAVIPQGNRAVMVFPRQGDPGIAVAFQQGQVDKISGPAGTACNHQRSATAIRHRVAGVVSHPVRGLSGGSVAVEPLHRREFEVAGLLQPRRNRPHPVVHSDVGLGNARLVDQLPQQGQHRLLRGIRIVIDADGLWVIVVEVDLQGNQLVCGIADLAPAMIGIVRQEYFAPGLGIGSRAGERPQA